MRITYRCALRPEFAPCRYFAELDDNGFQQYGPVWSEALYYSVIVPDFKRLDVSHVIPIECNHGDGITMAMRQHAVGLRGNKEVLLDIVPRNNITSTVAIENILSPLVQDVVNKCHKYHVQLPTQHLFQEYLERADYYPYFSRDPHMYFNVTVNLL